ncbi:hypothetical protein IT399_01525 [Candidatus Nomurabacteria bacterium]|nr:hypothetical protein [Candidatus Nomurabacteria bacterium]
MKKIFKFIPILFLVGFSPFTASAATAACPDEGLSGFVCNINNVFSSILPLLISLGVLYFVWGVVQYVIYDSEEAKDKGRDRIIYGIVGLAIIIGMWGLVNIVVSTFFNSSDLTAPKLNTIVTEGSCVAPTPGAEESTFQKYIAYITCTINGTIIPLIFALATLMFIWGAVNFFIINADDESKRTQGKQFMIWGIVSLAVMLSVWGLVNILGATFGVPTDFLPTVPKKAP